MEPKYILIENFMSHKRTEIDCTLFQSALIMGQFKSNPRESNGVGKSVILHSIEYALFGTYPTDVIDDIIREGTDECKVIFDFYLGTDIYRVERSRRKGKSLIELYKMCGSVFDNISQRTPTDTHSLLQTLLKINVNTFRNSVQFSQSNIDGLLSSKGKAASKEERSEILKEAMDSGIYKLYEKDAKKYCDELSGKITTTRAIIDSVGNPQQDIELFQSDLFNVKNQIIDFEKERDTTIVVLESSKKEFSDLQQLVSSEASVFHEKLSDIQINLDQVSSKIRSVKSSIVDNEKNILNLNGTIENKCNELKLLEEQCNNLRSKNHRPPSKIKQELEASQQNELNGKAYISSLETKSQDLKKPLPEGEQCPTCLQPVTKDYRNSCNEKIHAKLSSILDEIADKKPKLKKVINKRIKLQNELDDANKTINFISTLEAKITSKQSEIFNDKEYVEKLKSILIQMNNELEVLSQNYTELLNRKKTLKENLEKVSNKELEEKILIVKNKIDEYTKVLNQTNTKINNCLIQVNVLNTKIEIKQSELSKLEQEKKKINDLEYQYIIGKKVRRAFSSGGIPTMIIHSILDDLQLESNALLSELKPGLELQFTSEMDILFKYHGKNRTFYQLSGGQKISLALALRLGLSLLIQKRLGVNIKLLQLDEVDQSLDEAAVDAYAEIIKKLQNKFKIFVITHNSLLKDKFNDIILVEGDENEGATSTLISL